MKNALTGRSEDIYRQLKQEILSLTLRPGRSISENELCARFGVSRTPIRSALQQLQGEGLVSIVPYKGTTVTLLSLEDIEQHIFMRIAVESMVLREYLELCTPLQLEKVRYLLRQQTVLVENHFDNTEFYQLDSQLHAVWFEETGRQLLWQMIQDAQANYTRFRMLDIVVIQNYKQILQEHWEIFDLLEKKDKAGIEPLMRRHLYGGINRMGEKIYSEYKDYFQPFPHPWQGALT